MAKEKLKSIMKLTALAFLLLALCLAGACSQSPESGDEGSSKPAETETPAVDNIEPSIVPQVEIEDSIPEEVAIEEVPGEPDQSPEQVQAPVTGDLVPIELKLPIAMFVGTPQNIQVENLRKESDTARPPFLAPKGTTNLALGKSVTSSDDFLVKLYFINA